MHSFLLRAPTHQSFTLTSRFLYELKHRVYICETVCGIFHVWFRLVFIRVNIFVQQEAWTVWLYNVMISFKIEITEKPYTVLLPDLCFLSFKNIILIKFNDICLSWNSPKTDLETNFLNFKNQSFEYTTFSQK